MTSAPVTMLPHLKSCQTLTNNGIFVLFREPLTINIHSHVPLS